jgi:hypothetical protein
MTILSKLTKSIGSASTKASRKFNVAAAAAVKPEGLFNPAPQEENSRPVVPVFWTGESAIPFEKFQVDCSKFDMQKIVVNTNTSGTHSANDIQIDHDFHETKVLIDQMSAVFNEVGALQLINTGLVDFDEMEKLSKTVSGKGMWYEGGANLRGYLEKNVYDTGAPRHADLHYHHEMAYVKESTKWLAFLCEHAPKDPEKGATFIADNVKTTDDLMSTNFGQKLKEKGLCYIRKLPDLKYFKDNNLDSSIVYNYWQTSMGTDDMDEAVEVANRMGLDVEWEESPIFGRYMVTKFYVSAFEYCPYTDRNLLYASLADDYMWFDTWPGVMDLPHWERPLKLNFGDDEVMTREEKQEFVDVYDRHGVPIWWKKGDIAVICNFRTAHGRPQYGLEDDEKRELGVVLGETFSRVGDLPDKW